MIIGKDTDPSCETFMAQWHSLRRALYLSRASEPLEDLSKALRA